MAENRVIKEEKVKNPSPSNPSLFTQIEQKLDFENLFLPENYTKYLFKFVWVVALGMVYIYNSHVRERFSRDHDKLIKKVED